jgi:oligosaccharide amylase
MPRDLPIGNGSLLINFDTTYQIRDVYFPHVGHENQSEGHAFRFGIWVDGTFHWITDPGWKRDMRYETDTLVTRVVLHHSDFPFSFTCTDAVDFNEPLYIRRIVAENFSDQEHEVRFFFHHDFHIYEVEIGDTAYYEPIRRGVFHYKDNRWFLMNCGRAGEPAGVDQFATGNKDVGGAEGTWRDAEDGHLEGNPIAKGSVDSTIALHTRVPAHSEQVVYYWLIAGETFDAVNVVSREVRDKLPDVFLNRTMHYWRLWVNKEATDFGDLPPDLCAAYRRSLLVLRTQIDESGGIIAATDYDIVEFGRDSYSYVWPRDGALVCNALDMAGYEELTERFFNFCRRVLTKEGYFLHKYNPDGSLASSWHPWYADGARQLPIQEDETGLVLWSLWRHFDRDRDIEFIKPLYRSLIVTAADFLVTYRDDATGLPLASYDLWEERRGILAFTVGAVYGGLIAAANFSDVFGEHDLAERYRDTADHLKTATEHYLWRPEAKRFVRLINKRADGEYDVDWCIDSSMCGLWQFGMFSVDDQKIVSTVEAIAQRLWVKTPVGGVARYENDYYHQVSQDIGNVAGNPWFICTLWLAQYQIARAKSLDELEPGLDLIRWVASRALPSGVLAEQVHPYSDAPLSVSPLTWSHAELVYTILSYIHKCASLSICPRCKLPTHRGGRRPLIAS